MLVIYLQFLIYHGNKKDYIIYNKYQTSQYDISCTNQNTNGKIEVTLITCNNIKGNRLIFKATEKL